MKEQVDFSGLEKKLCFYLNLKPRYKSLKL